VARLPLRRPEQGRWVGGVAIGLAAHLGLKVGLVRIAFALLAPLGGVGVALYGFLWLTVPAGDPAVVAVDERPGALARLARRQQGPDAPLRRWPVTDIAAGLALVLGALALIAGRNGALDLRWVVPVLLVVAGLVLAWSQLDAAQRDRLRARAGGRTPVPVLRLVGGLVVAGVGVLLLVGQYRGGGSTRGRSRSRSSPRWRSSRASGWRSRRGGCGSCASSATSGPLGRASPSGPTSRRTCTTRSCRRWR
jgi:phage shock protein PspC (stress-responsive transcriptional regulator)